MDVMIIPKKSSAVADELGVTYVTLYNLMRYQKLKPPQRDTSGDFVWLPADVEAARLAVEKWRR